MPATIAGSERSIDRCRASSIVVDRGRREKSEATTIRARSLNGATSVAHKKMTRGGHDREEGGIRIMHYARFKSLSHGRHLNEKKMAPCSVSRARARARVSPRRACLVFIGTTIAIARRDRNPLLPLTPETMVEIRAVTRHRVEGVLLARTSALPPYVFAEFTVGRSAFVVLDAPAIREDYDK